MDPENRPTFKALVGDLSQDLTHMADYLTLSQEDPVASEEFEISFTMENHTHNGGERYVEGRYTGADLTDEENGYGEGNVTYLNMNARYVDFVETGRGRGGNDDSREEMNSTVSPYVDDDGYTLAQDLGPPVD